MAAASGPGDAELDLDLTVGQAPGDEQEDLALAGREGLDLTRPGATGGVGRRRARHAGHEAGQHLGAEQRLPLMDGAHGVNEGLGVSILEQEAAGAGAQGAQNVVVNLEHGEDEDARGRERRVGADPSGGLDAGQARHLDVHEDDVGEQLGGQGDRTGTVLGQADDAHAGLGLEQGGQGGAQEGLVLGDEDPDGGAGSLVGLVGRRVAGVRHGLPLSLLGSVSGDSLAGLRSGPVLSPEPRGLLVGPAASSVGMGRMASTAKPGASARGPAVRVPPSAVRVS